MGTQGEGSGADAAAADRTAAMRSDPFGDDSTEPCYYGGLCPMNAFSPALRFWRRWVAACARYLPLESPTACMAGTVLFLVGACGLLPNLEGCARRTPLLVMALGGWKWGWLSLRALQGGLILAAYAGAGLFQARCLQLCFPDYYDAAGLAGGVSSRRRRRAPVAIAGMPVEPDELRTSILVTGVTGSAKTAGVLLPALAQLLAAYHEDSGAGEFQKLGAFIPEVKGDLVDAAIYLAHEAGRCVSREVLIISPSSRIPVVRYRDEAGRAWYLAGRGGSGGSEAGDLLPALVFPPDHPRSGERVSAAALEDPADVEAVLPSWARAAIPLGARRPRFIGWRWQGDRLRRVRCTNRPEDPELVPEDGCGNGWATPPGILTAETVLYVDNRVHYNLVDARLPPAEAAERLTRLATLARGTAARGENDYFYEQGRKLIAACISLHRAVSPAPCTAADIVRLATQDGPLEAALAALAERLGALAAAAEAAEAERAEEIRRRRIAPLRELEAFFRDEWRKMVADGKTANVIKSTLSAAFGLFLQDANLAETFCQPSSFSFEDIIQSGKLIGLVPGDRYEQLGRLLGTACKMDFQSTMLSRNGRPDLNPTRLALYFADECHKYIVSGSASAGDPYFMNLSRSNHVVNLCATQSYAWIVEVLGREAANVYISAFGVQFWLQQTDPETCRRAAEICGSITREKFSAEHDLNLGGLLGALGSGREMVIRHRRRDEESPRHRAEDFALLDVGEVVAYNKGRPGRFDKVTKGRVRYHFCTSRPAGVAAVHARVREYYREVLENLADDHGEMARWDCDAPVPPPVAAAPAAAVPDPTAPAGLTAQDIGRERAAFAAYVGSLDAAVGELTGEDPIDLALADAAATGVWDSAAQKARQELARVESVRRAAGRRWPGGAEGSPPP